MSRTWEDLPSNRADAIRLGVNRYFTGKPCPRGHVEPRFTKWTTCVECSRLKSKKRYEEQPEYYAERNRSWVATHPEENRESSRRHMESLDPSDRSKIRRQGYIRWREKDPVRAQRQLLKNTRVRRALKKRATGTISTSEWEDLKSRWEYRCLACGKHDEESSLTLDHIIPLALGGSNKIENAQPLCKPCNSSKGVKVIDYRIGGQVAV